MDLYLKIAEVSKDDSIPEVYLRAWEGLIFRIDPDYDVIESGRSHKGRIINGQLRVFHDRHVMVDSITALRLLTNNSLEAAGYFVTKWPAEMYHNSVCFGWDEVKVLPSNQETAEEYEGQFFSITTI